MRKSFFVIVAIVLFALSSPRPVFGQQAECEKQLLQDYQAKEVLSGPEYDIFLTVVAAFGRDNLPRLYIIPGDGSAAYIAGSVSLDGKGKIILSRPFAELMGNAKALKGILAHEVGHLALEIPGGPTCDQMIMRDPEVEEAADVLAARKVGFDTVRAFLSRVSELTGVTSSETTRRFQHLLTVEEREVQGGRQR